MYLPEVELHRPQSLDEAAAMLNRYAPDARYLAGGTDVLVDLKTRRIEVKHLVNLTYLQELRGIEATEAGFRIGALTSIGQLLRSSLLCDHYPALREAASRMAAPQIRHAATVGGNIAGAVPCADLPPVLMVLNTSVEIWSPDGVRMIPMERCFLSPRETVLQNEEILLAIHVPLPSRRFGAAYERFSLREGNAIAVASVGAGVQLAPDGTVESARLALGAVAPTPKLVASINAILSHRRLEEDVIDRAAEAAREAAEPISDLRGSSEFRRNLVGVLTRRSLARANERAMEVT